MTCRLDCPPGQCLHPSSGCAEMKTALRPEPARRPPIVDCFDEIAENLKRIRSEVVLPCDVEPAAMMTMLEVIERGVTPRERLYCISCDGFHRADEEHRCMPPSVPGALEAYLAQFPEHEYDDYEDMV